MIQLVRITTVPVSLDKLLGQQLSFMNQHFSVTAVAADETNLLFVAEKYGVKSHSVEMTREITPFSDLKAIRKLYRFLKDKKPEIVHTHTPKAGFVGMLAAWAAGVPHRLHTVAGLPLMETTGVKRKVLDSVEKLTYASATKVYPNSKGLSDFVLTYKYAPAEKVKVIANGSSNGIDTSYFAPDIYSETQLRNLRLQLGLDENDFVFVFVGRLVGDKGINELISAFKILHSTLIGLHNASCPKLLLVGSLESELDPLAKGTLAEIEHNPNILTVGYQQDVRPYFAISDALVFPSYREGFPNVVMQAGAMGLPAIVTDINGCNEIIVQGKNGTIVPTKDIEALCSAMERMIKDRPWRERLRNTARSMITSRYEQQVVWDALLQEYNALLCGK